MDIGLIIDGDWGMGNGGIGKLVDWEIRDWENGEWEVWTFFLCSVLFGGSVLVCG